MEILGGLDSERAADVLEEMEPDDAADLINDLPPETAQTLLDLMEPEDADDVRRLLTYEGTTAGGMMTPSPVILPPDATVADALARVRQEELTPAVAALVYVVRPPLETPTGKLIGVAHIQRLLREPPSSLVSAAADTDLEPLRAESTIEEVARHLATYNLVAAPVVDEEGRLLGSVTVDDLIDHLLPRNWRDHEVEGVRHGHVRDGAFARNPRSLDTPRELSPRIFPRPRFAPDTFGRFAETFARFMGTARFLIYMTLFVAVWLLWNFVVPSSLQFDSPKSFILLTFILSLQASYAAPAHPAGPEPPGGPRPGHRRG